MIPGSKVWDANLIGFTSISKGSYRTPKMRGGVIEFDDGTLWSYEAESPSAYGTWPSAPEYWFSISERKTDSDAWERLMPDLWGQPSIAQPPGHPLWPSIFSRTDTSDTGWLSSTTSDFEGALNVASLGYGAVDWQHVRSGDDVWFYSRTGQESLGPIKVNKTTRRWERFITSAASRDLWSAISSNMVLDDKYMWFLASPATTGGMRLCRARIYDPNDVIVVHQWSDGGSWDVNINTSNIALPDYIDNQYLIPGSYSIAIENGFMYYFTPFDSSITDYRSINPTSYSSPGSRNWTMKYSFLRRFRIGDYALETLMWHTSPQGWVGVGAVSGIGTLRDATVGITSQPDLSTTNANDFDAVGMGMHCSGEYDMKIADGWLYWVDWSGREQGEHGEMAMICRVKLSRITGPGPPIQHDVMDPAFEIVSNANVPDEGYNGHWGHSGTWIAMRGGSGALMPWMNTTLTFASDGAILYKGIAFPSYLSDYRGRGVGCIWRLVPPVKITEVTLDFVGNELRGYSNIRQVPTRSGTLEVELS